MVAVWLPFIVVDHTVSRRKYFKIINACNRVVVFPIMYYMIS